MTDLLLSFRLAQVVGEGELLVRASDGREQFEVRMDMGQASYQVFENGEPLGAPGRGKLPARMSNLHVEVSLFDRQFLLVHFPAQRIDLGPWHFQVPDPRRIRYIR